MRNLKRIIVVSALWFFCVEIAPAQKSLVDSVHHINGVEITTDRFSHSLSGVKVDNIDSVSLKSFSLNNIGQLLLQNASAFIKTNGITGLSSVSVRGTGTSHTAVLWNGFNIQNPMNGGMDLSLIPVSFIDIVALQYNGISALYGSGAIGGALHLSTIAEFNKGLGVSIGGAYGSFNNYGSNFKIGWSNQKIVFKLKVLYAQGENNFPFINIAKYGAPKVRQSHNEMSNYGATLENSYKIGNKNVLNLRLWYQNSRRNIPPLMTQEINLAEQDDEFIRSSVEWNRKGEKYNLYVRSAFFYEEYEYKEPEKDIFSFSGSTSSVTEAEIYFKIFPFHTLNIGMQYKYTGGFCDYYLQKHSQNEVAAFLSYNISGKNEKWKINVSMREGYSQKGFYPFLPSLSMDVRLYKELYLYANVSRNFRMPTLNDMYWYPGGNTELKPENGYAEELGLKHQLNWEKLKFDYTISGFNNNTQNWIIWLPVFSYWSPQNIQAVWSRGTELDLKFEAKVKKLKLVFADKVSYVKATIQKSNNESSIGRQLIYTPEFSNNASLSFFYRYFYFNFNFEYFSKSYTSPDNSDFIKAYVIGNVYLSKDFHYKSFIFNLFLQLNNIWDQEYQSIAWQAMPGFNLKTGIQINFNYLKNKTK